MAENGKDSFFAKKLKKLKMKHKLLILQVACVILLLLITDSVIIGIVVSAEKQENRQEMDNIADSVRYSLNGSIENAIFLMQKIYANDKVNEMIHKTFTSPLEYYNYYTDYILSQMTVLNTQSCQVVIYADNPGIINGGYCRRAAEIMDEVWYQELKEEKREIIFYSDIDKNARGAKRSISIVKRMDFYAGNNTMAVLKLDLDYSSLLQSMLNAKYSNTVYICAGDDILFSNEGKGGLNAPFGKLPQRVREQCGVHKVMSVYGNTWDIYVMPSENAVLEAIRGHRSIMLLLLIINMVFPFMLMSLIDRMYHNDYQKRLRRQENDIARQRAELLALHSQINPHFLFNALESIRMHSVLKEEYETAEMVEKLALMQRQNVEWGNDTVTIKDEIRFVEAYLELQKYRFGEKLHYQMEIEEELYLCRIPKLTLVTFVENACVHGMEHKTSPVWIFVRAYECEGDLLLEIEDTGSGMDERVCKHILQQMQQVNIEMLQQGGRVGILNAALRLKMYTQEHVRFEMESERGTGTMVTIAIAKEKTEEGR